MLDQGTLSCSARSAGAAVCGFTPIARRSSHWTLLQKALLTALIAVCAKPMRCFVSLHGFLWRIYESTRSHLAKFILLLLCAPCFKLSYLFFKLTYTLQERRSLLLYSPHGFMGINAFAARAAATATYLSSDRASTKTFWEGQATTSPR